MRSSTRIGSRLTSVLCIAVLVAVVGQLQRLGRGRLSAPPLLHWSLLHRWVTDHDGPTMAMSIVRIVALAIAWYLLAVIGLGLLARLTRIPRLIRLVDLATVPSVRRLLSGAIGAGMTASMGALTAVPLIAASTRPAPATAQHHPAPERRATMEIERLPVSPSASPDAPPRRPAAPHTATMRVVSPAAPSAGPTRPAVSTVWTVRPGEHFWHAAETTLARAWGRIPSEHETASYWKTMVDQNRSRLADPANPDLIFPGQLFQLPPPPPPPVT